MGPLTADIPQEEFDQNIQQLIARSTKAAQDGYYFHCEGNREYLGGAVLPIVEQALNALVAAVEAERLRVASGADWDQAGLRKFPGYLKWRSPIPEK